MPTDVVGEGISDWSYDDRAATLRLSFESERRGPFTFRVLAERRVAELMRLAQGLPREGEAPAEPRLRARDGSAGASPSHDFDLSSIEMVAAKRNDGFLAISPRTNVALRSTAETRLTPIDPAHLPDVLKAYPDIALAYSFNQPEWRLGLQCTAVEPVIEAQTLSIAKFRQGQATVETDIRYQILKAGLNSLQVILPPRASNSSVTGEGIRSKELAGETWTILLDEKKKGDYQLHVRYEAALDPKADTFNYTGVNLPGVNRQTGYILLAQERPDAEVAVTEALNAQPMDERELPPQFAAKRDLPVLQCYRYSAPDRRVACRVLGRELSEAMLQASAPACEIQTVVKHTGEAVSYLRCDLRNTRKQFLKVKLGEKADLWGAYVFGTPVRTSLTQDGSYLIPIAEPTVAVSAFPVEMIWAEPVPPLRLTGSLALDTPEFDVKVEKMSWRVHVPAQYKLRAAAGNMKLLPYEERPTHLVALAQGSLMGAVQPMAAALGSPALFIAVPILVLGGIYFALRRVLRLSRVPAILITIFAATLLAGMMVPPLHRARFDMRLSRAGRVFESSAIQDDWKAKE
ncbi:MAG: hypothetical protein FJ272_19755, partial [Planctomycetes bacterium]|nr:hypothetical protein [Planctomycetota bacterium]